MLLKIFILFTIIPIIELYILIKVGSVIGALPTVALVISISLSGAWLVKKQGFGILRRIQLEMSQGRVPTEEFSNGLMVMIGGLLLVTPGLFTDLLGLFFLIPFTRSLIKNMALIWWKRKFNQGVITITGVHQD